MPIQAPQWTEFLSCPICYHMFDEVCHRPISLACGHTVCKTCLTKLPAQKKCPFDQTLITRSVDELPVNFALLQLVGVAVPDDLPDPEADLKDHLEQYTAAKKCIEELAIFLKPLPQVSAASSTASSLTTSPSFLSRPMQRKLVSLVNCQLIEEEGRVRAVKAARSLGERTVTELILLHQNPQQLSANLWAGVRARGCQFLGPAMQEEVLRLILLALEDGSALSRKVLVLFVVQRLESQYPQASKTAIGHVVQLLYRASCFKVTKREEESSLMQLKDEFRTYEALRREHDSQIVQIATEAGLRISPEQWSSLLYGDTGHKSHMQSIIDKLQSPQSFGQSITELTLALTRTGDPGNLFALRRHLELLANVDPNAEHPAASWELVQQLVEAALAVVRGLLHFTTLRSHKALHDHHLPPSQPMPPRPANAKYKTSMCRDLTLRGQCPRTSNCTFAHSHEEMEKFRARSKKLQQQQQQQQIPSPTLRSMQATLTHPDEPTMAVGNKHSPDNSRGMSVSRASMKSSTHTSSQPSKPIMSVSTHASSGVMIPTARPSLLPGSTKQMLLKESIYSSSTLVEVDNGPNVMPIPQHAPTLKQAHQARGKKAENDDAFMCTTMAMPPNPYTTPPQNNTNTLKTPMKQLGELHRRRDELLSRLKPLPAHPQVSPPISCPSPALSPQMDMSHGSVSSSIACSVATSLATSLASSHASCHTTMSLADMITSLSAGSVADSMATTYSAMSLADMITTMSNNGSVADSMASTNATMNLANMISAKYNEQYSGGSGGTGNSGGSGGSGGSGLGSGDANKSSHYNSLVNETELATMDRIYQEEHAALLCDQGDEFVPFEHTTVSKYGPISRGRAKERLKIVPPVNVTAGQKTREMVPVMAVTPNQHHSLGPTTSPWPPNGRAIPSAHPQAPAHAHPSSSYPPQLVMAGNAGVHVAASLPTALLKPHVIAAANQDPGALPPHGTAPPHTLWALREKMLSMTGGELQGPTTSDQHKIHADLCCVSQKIKSLQASEEERMTRELQAIELNIKETQRRVSNREAEDFLLAREEQRAEVAREQEKAVQEAQDRNLAQELALQEARDAVIRANSA